MFPVNISRTLFCLPRCFSSPVRREGSSSAGCVLWHLSSPSLFSSLQSCGRQCFHGEMNNANPSRWRKTKVQLRSWARGVLARECEVISLHTPLTPVTHHIIRRETLELMKPGAILINVSRGGAHRHKGADRGVEIRSTRGRGTRRVRRRRGHFL